MGDLQLWNADTTPTELIKRNNLGQVVSCIDIVFSPDDGGWYFHEYDFIKNRDRVGKRIFRSAEDAQRAFSLGTVKWEKW